jgi:hypothetical protein
MLPPGATWLNRNKPRPYVLATPCDPTRRGTLVYGSTRETERAFSAANVEIQPRSLGVNANGLQARTFFYPGVLMPAEYPLLPAHTGNLAGVLRDLRQALRNALGIGSGTCLHPAAPARSRRGRIVLLDARFTSAFHTRYAVVLTEHRYSCSKRYQVVVPIVRGDGVQEGPNVVRVERQDWFAIFPDRASTALLVAPVVQSVWHDEDIVDETPFVIDSASLELLEGRLCAMFGIEERSG